MVNGTLLNFGKRYDENLRVIFDQWLKLHLGFDSLNNQKIFRFLIYKKNKEMAIVVSYLNAKRHLKEMLKSLGHHDIQCA